MSFTKLKKILLSLCVFIITILSFFAVTSISVFPTYDIESNNIKVVIENEDFSLSQKSSIYGLFPENIVYSNAVINFKLNANDVEFENSLDDNSIIVSNNTTNNNISEIESLESKVRSFIGEYENNIGISYKNLVTNEEFSINGDQYFGAASTIKVPMNLVLIDMQENQLLDSANLMNYLDCDYEGGTGILQYSDLSNPFSLATLSEYSIIYSDNIASNMIIRKIGYEEMRNKIDEIYGHQTDHSRNIITPNEALSVLTTLYSNRDNSNYANLIELMKNTVFHTRMDAFIPSEITAHKIGTYGSYVNDIGIVFANTPYCLCIYTNSISDADNVIASISKIFYVENNR